MPNTSHLYLCPHCGEVVSASSELNPELNSSEITCPACQEIFTDKKPLPEVKKSPATAVTRDLTSQLKVKKNSDSRTLKKDQPAALPVKKIPPQKKKLSSPIEATPEENVIRHRKKRLKRNNKPFYFILLIWFSLLTLVVLLFNYGQDGDSVAITASPNTEAQERQLLIQRNQRFIQTHLEAAQKTINDYLDSINPIERQQVIDNPVELASVFARYYEINQIEILHKNRRAAQANVIDTPFGPAMEIVWIDQQQRALETLMIWDGDEWRVDWEQMVRYSDTPWNLFQSGIGPDEGTFRVYARRQASEDKENIRLVLYSPWPKALQPDSAFLKKLAIPAISIPVESNLGKELEAIFAKNETIPDYKKSVFTLTDPKDFLRLTLRLKFTANENSEIKNYEILNILAPNWHGRRLRLAEKKAAEEKAQNQN